MRRQTTYRRIAAELPPIGILATTRRGEVGEVIAHEDGQARLQFAGSVQGLYEADEITWQVVGAQAEGHWQTEGAELHLADRDYPELGDILGKPAPEIVQPGNEWGRTASKTASLNDKMDFDHVVQVLPGGQVVDANGVYAPSLMDDELDSRGWSLLDGYSGQSGYSGPIMHASEFIGGGLERDILSKPGYYVTLANYTSDDDEPEGWGIAYKAASKTTSSAKLPNNTDGFSVTTWDPFGEDSLKSGDCHTCFGEGAFSDLRPDGKGFGPEHDCPDCGGSGRA
jgi:hypothetical protein